MMNKFEEYISAYLDSFEKNTISEAMRYSMEGGKRFRPRLIFSLLKGMGIPEEKGYPAALALELIQTYSLIHDDLPCMDDDDLRRGKPTCHKVFGECTAVLAGDALQAEAFHRLAVSCRGIQGANGRACAVLAEAAGAMTGICAGQYLDLDGEGRSKSFEELTNIHMWKTAALLKAACLLGLIAAGVGDDTVQWEGAVRYAEELGMAFQIRDDMLDEESTTEELGKPVGSDVDNNKTTFVTLYGINKCRELVDEHTKRAKEAINGAFQDTGFLCWLADELAGRNH